MNFRNLSLTICAVAATLAAANAFAGAAPKADIPDKEARQAVIATASTLSHPVDPPPLPPELKNPFTFEGPAPQSSGAAGGAAGGRGGATGSRATRELLETIASGLAQQSPGILTLRGETLLRVGRSNFRKGDKIPVAVGSDVHDVELADIPNSTTYILRYNGETLTRSTRTTGK